MAWLAKIGKVLVALGPALAFGFKWLAEKADPRNESSKWMVKEQVREEKYENELKKYCVLHFLPEEGKEKDYSEIIRKILKKLV